jgi:flagellar hook-basal body complex protein FliE
MAGVGPISSVSGVPSPLPTITAPEAVGRKDDSFGAALGRALSEVNRLQLDSQDAASELASGRGDLLDTAVAVQKADVAFQFVVQIRNKLLEAYQDLMRMQV